MTYEATDTHDLYNRSRYSWRQVRDCVAGSNKIKEANEVYLPMPSAMSMITEPASKSVYKAANFTNNSADYERIYMPWYHPNPAYSAYLQRARFPDITANSLRGIMGLVTKYGPEVELPVVVDYMEKNADNDGNDLNKIYVDCISELLQAGKHVLVLDIDEDSGNFYIAQYCAESNINWKYVTRNGQCVLTNISLKDKDEDDKIIEYALDEFGFVVVNIYEDGNLTVTKELMYKGKRFDKIPVFCIGSVKNEPDPGVIPLLGISDIAICIYQEGADLRQGHYLTCNPTLFLFGVGDKETPAVIGSSVIVGIRNPAAKAEYPATDTSAFEHVRGCIKDLYEEAVSYGSAFVSNPINRESGQALTIRNASKGSNLVHMVNMVSDAFTRLFKFVAELVGTNPDDVLFEGNIDFAELVLNAQDVTALVSSWIQGAIDHDTVLDNLRDAGYISADKSNDDIKNNIETETPEVDPSLVDENGDPIDKNKQQDDMEPEMDSNGKPTGKMIKKMKTKVE